MNDQERINENFQRQIDMQGGRIDVLAVKVDALSDKIDLYVEESRASRARQDEDMRELRAGLNSMGNHVRNLSVATMVGVGTSVIAVVVMIGTVIYLILTR